MRSASFAPTGTSSTQQLFKDLAVTCLEFLHQAVTAAISGFSEMSFHRVEFLHFLSTSVVIIDFVVIAVIMTGSVSFVYRLGLRRNFKRS